MKKFLRKILLLSFITILSFSFTACSIGKKDSSANLPASGQTQEQGQDPEQSPLPTQQLCIFGPVKETTDNTIFIDNQSQFSSKGEMILTISPETTILIDAEEGFPVLLSDLTAGEIVYAFIGDAMTMSLPPQVSAEVVFCHAPEEFQVPAYIHVKSVNAQADKISMLVADDGSEFVVNEETSIFPYKTKNLVTIDDIQEGSQCVIWTDASGNASKILLLPEAFSA